MVPITIGVLGFDGVRALDLVGPLEAFATARRNAERNGGLPYDVMVIGLANRTFLSECGVVLKAQKTTRSAPTFDTIIIPGGAWLRNMQLLNVRQTGLLIAPVQPGVSLVYPAASIRWR